GFRDFKVPEEGEYVIRFRAAGRVPARAAVVASARAILEKRRDEQTAKNPERKESHQRQLDNDLKHFETYRSYDYGPPRVTATQNLGGTPRVVGELDIDAPESTPMTYEVRAYFSKQSAGVHLNYA